MYPNLEAELRRRKIRRVDIAEHFGLALSTVSLRLIGKKGVPLKWAVDIKRWLGVDMPLEDLFDTEPIQHMEDATA